MVTASFSPARPPIKVAVKLRFLTKRGKARKDRVEALKAEKEDLEAKLQATKVWCVSFFHSVQREITHVSSSHLYIQTGC